MSQTQIDQLIHGRPTQEAVKRVAEKATGEPALVTTEHWIAALREVNGLAVEFTLEDSLFDSYLWWENGGYRAAELGPGLEEREGRPLDRIEAAALLDGAVLAMAEPVHVSEVPEQERS